MLYLKPPYYMYEDVAVFSDHEDPSQFYYLPRGPRFARTNGETDGQLLKYTSTSGDMEGGFLTFEVDLKLDGDTQERVESKIKQERGLEKVRMSPLHAIDGKVELILYDSGSASGKLVKATRHPAKPSLYGHNNAIFSVELSAAGVQLVEAALGEGTSPIGVLYTLTYVGLTPGYKVKAKADWKKVYEHFVETSKKGAWIFYSDTVKTEVSKMTDDRVIQIDIDSFTDESTSLEERKNIVVNQLTDLVLNKFFQPVVPDKKADGGGGGGLGSIFGSISGLFGSAGSIGYAVNSESTTQTYEAHISAEINERIAVRRTVMPNAFLGSIKGIGAARIERKSVVIGLDEFFRKRSLRVQSNADFEDNGIYNIQAEIDYGGVLHETVQLTATGAFKEFSWPMRSPDLANISYTVKFKPDAELDGKRPQSVKRVEPEGVKSTIFTIAPSETMFLLRTVNVETDASFPWRTYPTVAVTVRYGGGDVRYERVLTLTAQAPKKTFKYFSLDPSQPLEFEADLNFGGTINIPKRKFRSELLLISDPRPVKRTLSFDGDSVDWKTIKKVVVDVAYNDPDNFISIKKSVPIEAAKKKADVMLDIADSGRKQVSYTLTAHPTSGAARKPIIGGVTSDDDVPLTTADAANKDVLACMRTIDVVLDDAFPQSGDYDKIRVILRSPDAQLAAQSERFEILKDSQADRNWSYFFTASPNYDYRIEYLKGNQLITSRPAGKGYTAASAERLSVPVKARG